MQHGDEARQEDGDAAAAGEVALRAHPVRLADAASDPGTADDGAEPAPEPEPDALAGKRAGDDGDPEQDALEGEATAVLATSTTVSPGKTRPMSTLVSSSIATPASRVRRTGSTLCTRSRSPVSTSFTLRA